MYIHYIIYNIVIVRIHIYIYYLYINLDYFRYFLIIIIIILEISYYFFKNYIKFESKKSLKQIISLKYL